jgi:hypothetical protein
MTETDLSESYENADSAIGNCLDVYPQRFVILQKLKLENLPVLNW